MLSCVGSVYASFCNSLHLVVCLQVTQPQKRRLIRHVLDGTMGRYMYMSCCVGVSQCIVCVCVCVCVCVWYMTSASRVLELKHEMVNLELLEFQYFDDILTDLKLTPVREHTTTLYACVKIVNEGTRTIFTLSLTWKYPFLVISLLRTPKC